MISSFLGDVPRVFECLRAMKLIPAEDIFHAIIPLN
jgi:hypothetical protein